MTLIEIFQTVILLIALFGIPLLIALIIKKMGNGIFQKKIIGENVNKSSPKNKFKNNSKDYDKQNNKDHFASADLKKACEIFGIKENEITLEKINSIYNSLIKSFHPDNFNHIGDADFTALAEQRTKQINASKNLLLKYVKGK